MASIALIGLCLSIFANTMKVIHTIDVTTETTKTVQISSKFNLASWQCVFQLLSSIVPCGANQRDGVGPMLDQHHQLTKISTINHHPFAQQ